MKNKKKISFDEAIQIGEYQPEFLSTYEEWDDYTPYIQYQFITKAMDNRRNLLTKQMADMYNVLDLRLKPEVKEAINKIHDHLRKIESDREKLFIEYSSKF